MKKPSYIIGIDEAGRGPLAGPVSVGVAIVPADFDWDLLPGVNDSKKLTSEKREEIFKLAKKLKIEKQLDYSVVMVAAKTIDKIGIVPSIKKALVKALAKVSANKNLAEVKVLLDGGLKAPAEYTHQETIIKGDSKEKVIGLASIMAKVTRDNYMEKLAKKPEFFPYGFAAHKGYGTSLHLAKIKQLGLTPEHRRSFCRKYSSKQ